jgi:hypothetical protein
MHKPITMFSVQRFLLVLLFTGSLSSCIITKKFNSIQFEVLNPSEIAFPENIKTVALINRDIHCHDKSLVFYNYKGNWQNVDTIKNLKLANECLFYLSQVLRKGGRFEKVVNYNDTAFQSSQLPISPDRNSFVDRTRADLCIFIDSLRFSGIHVSGYPNLYQTKVNVSWSYTYRSDTVSHTFLRNDSIVYYDYYRIISYQGKKLYQISYLNLSCRDIGILLGNKLTQTWDPVQQQYYHSQNYEMLRAERFARKNEWRRAAEIWNQQAKSKNRKLAAKACYNMAVSCEMMGYPDLAIEWLNKTESGNGFFMKEYKEICNQYKKILVLRKGEIEKLDRQFGIQKKESPEIK